MSQEDAFRGRVRPELPPRISAAGEPQARHSMDSHAPYSSLPPGPRDQIRLSEHSRSPSASSNRSNASSLQPPSEYEERWRNQDPRSSSMHSLVPTESRREGRRKLFMIYVHGFMGTEESFRAFPAHVHNLLTVTLADTHVVHTKIYPRYRSRKTIRFARDAFSSWLKPHESPMTDIVLLGHSLGGLLAAEVALMQTNPPDPHEIYQHRILGIVAFDTPFLGMHPGVVSTGLASLFKPDPGTPEAISPYSDSIALTTRTPAARLSPAESTESDPFRLPSNDPNYNASFMNDVIIPERTKLERLSRFVNKHWKTDGLTRASKQYVMSHLEFGGCMANYVELRNRYDHIRALEDVNELEQKSDSKGRPLRRVRFVNYYSASSGLGKRAKSPAKLENGSQQDPARGRNRADLSASESNNHLSATTTRSAQPRLSLEEHSDGSVISKPLSELEDLEPLPQEDLKDSEDSFASADESISSPHDFQNQNSGKLEEEPLKASTKPEVEAEEVGKCLDAGLPPIPALPNPPAAFDSSKYTDKDTLKLAQKEHNRSVKEYEQAKKNREKSIREREKLIKKREKVAAKQRQEVEKSTKSPKQAQPQSQAEGENKRLKAEEERMAAEKRRLEGTENIPTLNRSTAAIASDKYEQLAADDAARAAQLQAKITKRKETAKLQKHNQTILDKQRAKRVNTLNPHIYDKQLERENALLHITVTTPGHDINHSENHPYSVSKVKKFRDRKFCTLPPKDKQTGLRDKTWIRVWMGDVDEVVAHTTLFVVSETYGMLVGDTAARVEAWVKEAENDRVVLGEVEEEWEREEERSMRAKG